MPTRSRSRAVTLAGMIGVLLMCAGCSVWFPAEPEAVGDGYPDGGIPTSVAWPSDWLTAIPGESDAVPGSIVGLRLEYVNDQWVWRVRSKDPTGGFFEENPEDSTRGKEALLDAERLETVTSRAVELTDAELSVPSLSAAEAAQRSGEEYPSPRLIELERVLEDGRAVWSVTVEDTETAERSETTIG
jgi:hypothetical protein